MPGLPPFSGELAVRAFRKAGWIQDRQHGSHTILVTPGNLASLSVPKTNDDSDARSMTSTLIDDHGPLPKSEKNAKDIV